MRRSCGRKKKRDLSNNIRYLRAAVRVKWGIDPDAQDIDLYDFMDMATIDMGEGQIITFDKFCETKAEDTPDSIDRVLDLING